jgi:hypothetical protein
MSDVIPVLDLGPCWPAGRALRATAAEPRGAGGRRLLHRRQPRVPRELIERTFAEARRFRPSPRGCGAAHERAQQRLHGAPVRRLDMTSSTTSPTSTRRSSSSASGHGRPAAPLGRRFVG